MISNCAICAHRDPHYYRCKAFPQGIPMIIGRGKQKHDEVLAEQQGDYIFVEHHSTGCANLRNRLIQSYEFSFNEALHKQAEQEKAIA